MTLYIGDGTQGLEGGQGSAVQGSPQRAQMSPLGSLEEEKEDIPEPLTPNPGCEGEGAWREDISHRGPQGPQGPHSHFLTPCPGTQKGEAGPKSGLCPITGRVTQAPPACQMLIKPQTALRCKNHELAGMTAWRRVKNSLQDQRGNWCILGTAGAASPESGHRRSRLTARAKPSACVMKQVGLYLRVGP